MKTPDSENFRSQWCVVFNEPSPRFLWFLKRRFVLIALLIA